MINTTTQRDEIIEVVEPSPFFVCYLERKHQLKDAALNQQTDNQIYLHSCFEKGSNTTESKHI